MSILRRVFTFLPIILCLALKRNFHVWESFCNFVVLSRSEFINEKNFTTMENNANKENKNQLQIQLKPEVADGKYSNLAMIGHGPNEFLIDFIFAAPGMPQAPVVSRIIMTPENAKQLMYALTDNVQKYEANFGEIKQKRAAQGPKFSNN